MISDNEYLENFDENFLEQESIVNEHMILLEDATKTFDSLNLEAQNILKNSFDVEKVYSLF